LPRGTVLNMGEGLSRAIRVRYEKGTLRPLDTVEFKEGEELEIIIIRRSFSGFQEGANRYKFRVDRDVVEEFVEERR